MRNPSEHDARAGDLRSTGAPAGEQSPPAARPESPPARRSSNGRPPGASSVNGVALNGAAANAPAASAPASSAPGPDTAAADAARPDTPPGASAARTQSPTGPAPAGQPPLGDPPGRSTPLALRAVSRVLSATTRDRLHNALIDAPVAGEAYVRMRTQLRHGLVTPRTELILEGYPRSANAYAEWAFRYANGEDLRIAVRLHSPRAVRFGVEHGIPTIVLLRPPRDAVASWLQYKPGLKAERAFRRYALYYEQVYPLRNEVVIAEFTDVVADFGAVIERCNARFGTSFVPYPGDAAAEAWVRARIESAWAYDETGETPEHRVPRPSSDRHDAEELLEGLMNDPRVAKAVSSAEKAWERMSEATA